MLDPSRSPSGLPMQEPLYGQPTTPESSVGYAYIPATSTSYPQTSMAADATQAAPYTMAHYGMNLCWFFLYQTRPTDQFSHRSSARNPSARPWCSHSDKYGYRCEAKDPRVVGGSGGAIRLWGDVERVPRGRHLPTACCRGQVAISLTFGHGIISHIYTIRRGQILEVESLAIMYIYTLAGWRV